MAFGFGSKAPRNDFGTWGGTHVGTYNKGFGYSQDKGVRYRNDLGETVSMTSGILRDSDGNPHKAYAVAPGTELGKLIEKQRKGFPLTSDERLRIRKFWASNPTAGLTGVSSLGGNHNGGTATNGALTWGNM